MAIKRKTAPKPTPKPAARPTPKPLPRPKPAPLDLVRSPNFDAAMAQRNYDNFIAEQRARMGAERSQSGNQDFIDSRDPNKNYMQDMVDYIDPATGEKTSRTRGVVPAPGSRFVRANQAGGLAYNQIPPMGTGGTALPQEFSNRAPAYDVSKLISDYQAQRDAPRLMPIQTPGSNALNQDLANRGMGGGIPAPMPQGFPDDMQKFRNAALAGMGGRMPTPIPEAQQGAMAFQYQNPQSQQQQMQNYQNFLQQGMQNSNTLNQGAMNNFANMQPGMQATQTASTTTPNQTMPVAGMGSQKPKVIQLPRTFSTRNNQSARFA